MLKKYIKFFSITTLVLASFSFSETVFADATKLVFITDTQNISSGEISGPITVQLQDDTGIIQKATETIYLNLSSSNNGEFSSSKDAWKVFSTLPSDFSTSSIYISSNTASRTLYYKGLSSGEHNIIVSAKSRSGRVFDNISQIIGVDTSMESTSTRGISTTTDPTSTLDQISTSTNSNNINQQTVARTIVRYISLHSSPEDLSSYDENPSLDISAGRERVTYIGMPVKFSAKYKNKILDCSTPTFSWSFGDGTKYIGKDVSHAYRFSGEYNIVLNASCGSKNSVSRTKVSVLKPEVSFSYLPSGDLLFKNLGKIEINLGDWKIRGNSGMFEIPEDTIIGAGKDIVISKDYSRIDMGLDGVSLFDPSGSLISMVNLSTPNMSTSSTQISDSLTINQGVSLSESKSGNVDLTKEQADNFVYEFNRILSTQKSPEVNTSTAKGPLHQSPISPIVERKDQTASVYEALSKTGTTDIGGSNGGFWGSFFSLPIRGFKAVARVFYNI